MRRISGIAALASACLAMGPALGAQHSPLGRGLTRVTSLLPIAGHSKPYCFQVCFDPVSGDCFVASGGGLLVSDGYGWKTFARAQGLPSDFVRAVHMQPEPRRLWIGTDAGVCWLDPDSGEVQPALTGTPGLRNVRRIRSSGDGRIWLCADSWRASRDAVDGLYEVRWVDGEEQVVRHGPEVGLEHTYIMDFHPDPGGDHLVSTRSGIYQLRDGRWRNLLDGHFKGEQIRSLGRIRGGGLVFGTERGLFLKLGEEQVRRLGPSTHRVALFLHRAGGNWLFWQQVAELGFLRLEDQDLLELGQLAAARTAEQGPPSWEEEELRQILTRRGGVQAPAELDSRWPEEIVEAPDGSIWVCGLDLLARWSADAEWRSVIPQGRVAGFTAADGREFQSHRKPAGTGRLFSVAEASARRREAGAGPVRVAESWAWESFAQLPIGLDRTQELLRLQADGMEWAAGLGGLYRRELPGGPWEAVADLNRRITGPYLEVNDLLLRDGEVWFMTRDARGESSRLYRRDVEGRIHDLGSVDHRIACDRVGNLIYALDRDLVWLPAGSQRPRLLRTPHAAQPRRAIVDSEGGVWVSGRRKSYRFVGDGQPVRARLRGPEVLRRGDPFELEIRGQRRFAPVDEAEVFAGVWRLGDAQWEEIPDPQAGVLRLDTSAWRTGTHRLEVRLRDGEGLETAAPTAFELRLLSAQAWSPAPFWTGGAAVLILILFFGFRERGRLRRQNAARDAQLRQHADVLELMRRRFRRLLDQSSDAVLICTVDGVLIDYNAAARRLFGLEDGDRGRRSLRSLFESEAEFEECWAQLADTGLLWQAEPCLQGCTGEILQARLNAVETRPIPVPSGADLEGYQILVEDLSAERRMERRLRQSQKLEAIGQLAGGVAHDFNNLLQGILGNNELLEERLRELGADEEALEYVREIALSGRRASGLTAQLLAFSRRRRLRRQRVAVHGLLEELAALLRRTFDPRVEVVLELGAAQDVVVGDASGLHAACLNLALNGRDAMPEGGVLRIATAVTVLGEQEARRQSDAAGGLANLPAGVYLQISVSDEGVGMDTDVRAQIVEPFFTTKEVGKGTGLGLPAVYGTMLDHGGAVQVHSEPEMGTRVDLYLPIAPERDPHEQDGGPESDAGLPAARDACVLLVDDDGLVRGLGERLLRRQGYQVVTAVNGEDGVDRFRSMHARLCLVVLDMLMPVMNGRDALRAMQAIDPEVPVLIVSGYLAGQERAELQAAGAVDILPKPYSRESFLQQVARCRRQVAGGGKA